MKKYKCNCINVKVGSYSNQIALKAPIWSSKEYICVDRCLSEEIQELWCLGIETTGCCCGHNKVEPYIGVYPQYVLNMIKMGYELCQNSASDSAGANFIPKSIKAINI